MKVRHSFVSNSSSSSFVVIKEIAEALSELTGKEIAPEKLIRIEEVYYS